jgi:uncharacterized protein (TIGR03083 family)
MITKTTAVEDIPALEHDEAMRLATAEYDRLLALVDQLHDADWARPTDCTGWDVRAVLGHMLGMLKLQADPQERVRQIKTAAETAARTGGLRLDALTALQVREHARLTTDELTRALHQMAPLGLAARRATTAEQRAVPYAPALPGAGQWTMGYLFDVIHTRDPWMHRVDICLATGGTRSCPPSTTGGSSPTWSPTGPGDTASRSRSPSPDPPASRSVPATPVRNSNSTPSSSAASCPGGAGPAVCSRPPFRSERQTLAGGPR